MAECDVAVVGGGTAGLTAGRVLAAAGKRVILIEQGRLGGECTWDGCVPSKALLAAARIAHDARRAGDFGIDTGEVRVDFPAVMAAVRATIDRIARFEDAAHLEAEGIAVRHGAAHLLDAGTITVDGERISAGTIVLCTGSRPSIPPIEGLDGIPYLTNETLFGLERLPERLLIVGGGAIGLEMSQAFQRLGSAVTVLDIAPRLLPEEDAAVGDRAVRLLGREGITVLLGAEITRAESDGATHRLAVRQGDGTRTVEGDAVLVATGREPQVEGLGLEAIGVRVDRRGVVVDAHLRSSVDSIYAAGDVTGLYRFTHVAAYQARIVAENILGKSSRADYRVVPRVIFTDPEIARVGLTEQEARARHGDDVRVVELPYTALDRAVIERADEGVITVILGKKPLLGATGGGSVLGAQLIGRDAGQLVHEFVIAMQARTFAGRLAQAIHAYPTMSMGVQQAVGLLFPSGRATIDLRTELREE